MATDSRCRLNCIVQPHDEMHRVVAHTRGKSEVGLGAAAQRVLRRLNVRCLVWKMVVGSIGTLASEWSVLALVTTTG